MDDDDIAHRSAGRRRRRADFEDGSESESESDSEGDSAQPGPSSRRANHSSAKRPRLQLDSDSDAEPVVNGSNSSTRQIHRAPRRETNGADSAGFQPGAIVRVSVQNFVTYEKADFFPGPHLNMVIGPNGTGKSSLVCAICLGLGYSPKHLGRAGAVKEFVKHGKDTATIEIELQKRPQDRANFVVRVQIRREQNNQKWWLNGKETTHKKIQALMQTLRIQVDNLCQFLPQDRVVEFAASTPVDLLHETLRAAASEEMQQWHEQLRGRHKDKKEVAEAVQNDNEMLKNLQTRQAGLQSEVDRLREREEIQERIKNLQGALIMAKYQDARNKHTEAKEKKKAAAESLKLLERQSGPSLEAVNQKQAYAQAIESAIPSRVKALKDAQVATQSVVQDIGKAVEDMKEWENKIGAERKGFDERKKDVATSKTRITALQGDLKNRPVDFNAGEWNQKIRAEEHKLREIETDQQHVTSELQALYAQGNAKKSEQSKIAAEIEALNTQEGQQLSFMRKNFPEIATGWDWVQEHQGEFEKEVFGPPLICCSVKDERYSDQVQSLLQNDDFLCFTAQTRNDYKKLTNQLYRELSLSVVIRTCSQPLAAFRPQVNATEAEALGLDGFAIDYLNGPEPVLAMLCAEKRLHLSGVSLEDHSEAQYERLVRSGKVNNWAAGKHIYIIRRRIEYGPDAMTTVTKNIQPGKFWSSQPAAAQEKADLNRRSAEVKGELETMKAKSKEIKAKIDEFEGQKTAINEKIDELRKEKNILQREHQKWQSLPQKIESEERLKEANEQAMREARQSILDLTYEWDKAVLERARLVLRHQEAMDEIREAHEALLEAKIRQIEANSDVAGLKERNKSIMEELEEQKQQLEEASQAATRAREVGQQLGMEVRDLIAENEEKKHLYQQLAEGKRPGDLEMDISAEQANLELIHAANPNVLREYEKREAEIAKVSKKLDGSNGKLETLAAQLDELMGKWEPRLERLISSINNAFAYNFEQISCAGEVRIHKDEDFDQWALEIMVKFRENETLQQLNAHRQSGGERAVSTIFYLMALQSMAQAPFRVVDEINQGMDPRNERMVHERMVEIACREHTSQYFLITPKLLTGLRYDAKMRVLCIASGEHMPVEGAKLDFRRCLDVHRRVAALV